MRSSELIVVGVLVSLSGYGGYSLGFSSHMPQIDPSPVTFEMSKAGPAGGADCAKGGVSIGEREKKCCCGREGTGDAL